MKARKITLLKNLIPLCLLFLQGPLFANTHANAREVTIKTIPAAAFTQQPVSQTVCPGASVQFSVAYSGATVLSYQWQKNGNLLGNGTNVSGATTATLTINPVTEDDNAVYNCVVVYVGGIATSDEAWLNSTIESVSGGTACLNSSAAIEVVASGNNPQYQWYVSATNSNANGTLIAGATAAVYAPATDQQGTTYYYVVVYPEGLTCAATKSNPVAFTVTGTVSSGDITDNQAICPGTTTVVSISGYVGTTIQWQQSESGVAGWTDVTEGSGANSADYTTPVLQNIRYYRAVVSGAFCGTDTSGVTSVTPTTTFVWTGATDTNWFTAENWSCGLLPTAQNDVLIPANVSNKPVVTSGLANAKSLTVQNGASINVAFGGTLNLVNTVFIEDGGKMTVENDGALVQQNNVFNNGVITVNRNSNHLYRLDYTIWSSPVSGQNLSDFSPATSTNRFYEYKYDLNSSNQWIEGYWPVDPATTSFTAAKGLLIRMPNSNPLSGYNNGLAAMVYEGVFKGTPNNGTITIAASTANNRYTAVGNPYASPVNISDFFTANAGVLHEDTPIYLWRKRNNQDVSSYATVTLAGFVANAATNAQGEATEDYASGGQDQAGYFTGNSNNWLLSQGQGFIVKTAPGLSAPQITFTNSMRRAVPATGGQAFFKSAQQTASRLWANLSNTANAFSQAAVAYMDGATTGIDYGYDGKRLTDGDNIAIYTLAGANDLTIQARPSFENTDVVPTGYTATTPGSYTISLDHTEGVFANGQDVLLKDKVQGITRNLSESSYTFTTEAGTFNDRFELVYKTTAALNTDANELISNAVMVYKQGNAINIASDTAEISGVAVYDIRGRQLYAQNNINANAATVNNLEVQQQVVIVEVSTAKGKATKKIVL